MQPYDNERRVASGRDDVRGALGLLERSFATHAATVNEQIRTTAENVAKLTEQMQQFVTIVTKVEASVPTRLEMQVGDDQRLGVKLYEVSHRALEEQVHSNKRDMELARRDIDALQRQIGQAQTVALAATGQVQQQAQQGILTVSNRANDMINKALFALLGMLGTGFVYLLIFALQHAGAR